MILYTIQYTIHTQIQSIFDYIVLNVLVGHYDLAKNAYAME